MSQCLVLRLKALESSGNHKSPPSPPKKTMLNSHWIIPDSDSTTLTNVGRGEEPLHYQIRRLAVLCERKCKILNTLFPRL